MTTHELLEQAAAMLEAHGGQKLAEKVRAYAERNIPDVPIYEPSALNAWQKWLGQVGLRRK
jgi:hypothetical protein